MPSALDLSLKSPILTHLRKNLAELFSFKYDVDSRDGQLILDERRRVQALVLQRCAPYMIAICLSSFVCCFVALMVMPECWRLVIELDYLAMSSNVIGAIFLYRHLLPGARQELHDWQLAGAFYLPWVCVTFLQIAHFSCGDEARDGYYSTRLVYFCYRALLSVALMCPFQCTLAELICSGMVAADVQRSEARAALMSIELLFLLLIFAGTCFLGQRMIDWAFANARKAEEALSALVDARLGLIEKLCDAEVELSGELKMLEASASWGSRMGIQLASFEGSFLDIVDEEDAERVLRFLQSASCEGASSCIQASLRTFADDRVDARLYHAAQS
ncbi:MCM3, partial [Symbiodinium sp. CCMP2456]